MAYEEEYLDKINSTYQEMLMRIVNGGRVMVTELKRHTFPQYGYTGVVHYCGRGFRFLA